MTCTKTLWYAAYSHSTIHQCAKAVIIIKACNTAQQTQDLVIAIASLKFLAEDECVVCITNKIRHVLFSPFGFNPRKYATQLTIMITTGPEKCHQCAGWTLEFNYCLAWTTFQSDGNIFALLTSFEEECWKRTEKRGNSIKSRFFRAINWYLLEFEELIQYKDWVKMSNFMSRAEVRMQRFHIGKRKRTASPRLIGFLPQLSSVYRAIRKNNSGLRLWQSQSEIGWNNKKTAPPKSIFSETYFWFIPKILFQTFTTENNSLLRKTYGTIVEKFIF